MEKARANRTVFAQRRLKPEEVIPEWKKEMRVLGLSSDVERFTVEALRRLGAPPDKKGSAAFQVSPTFLPSSLPPSATALQPPVSPKVSSPLFHTRPKRELFLFTAVTTLSPFWPTICWKALFRGTRPSRPARAPLKQTQSIPLPAFSSYVSVTAS